MGSESSGVKTASGMGIGLVVEQRLNLGAQPGGDWVTTNRCDLCDQRSAATQGTTGDQRGLNLLMRASNDVGCDQSVADAFTGVGAGAHRSVHGTGLTAHHHGDVTTADIFTANQGHLRCFGHRVGSLDGWHHAAGLDHAQGNALDGR